MLPTPPLARTPTPASSRLHKLKARRATAAPLLVLAAALAACDDLTPPNRAPVAHLTAEPVEAYTGQEVNYDASESYDPDGDIVSYRWDFDGDGVTDTTTTTATTTHTYDTAGSYIASVTVEDNDGATATASLEEAVGVEAPEVLGEIAFGGRPEGEPAQTYSGSIVLRNSQISDTLENMIQVTYHLSSSPFPSSQNILPGYSPDGEMITFETNTNGPFQVDVVNADGSNRRQVVYVPEEMSTLCPSWSPDGKGILFAFYEHDELNMMGIGYTESIGDSIFDTVYETEFSSQIIDCPKMSPDGKSVLFKWKGDIWEINPEENTLENNTKSSYSDSDPRWIHDGSGFLFSSDREGRFDIYKYSFRDESVERLSYSGGVDPDISQDGNWLLFAKPNSNFLYLKDVRSERTDSLEFSEFFITRYPAWRPNPQNQ